MQVGRGLHSGWVGLEPDSGAWVCLRGRVGLKSDLQGGGRRQGDGHAGHSVRMQPASGAVRDEPYRPRAATSDFRADIIDDNLGRWQRGHGQA